MTRSIIAAVVLVATTVTALAQDAPYCPDLKQINNLAMTRERFAPIIGTPRVGNYRNTSLPLTGWTDCSFYGQATYTCDSQALKTVEDARLAQARVKQEILRCLAGAWADAPEQSGPDFVVLHPKLGPASITLSLDEADNKEHIVRITIFLRRS